MAITDSVIINLLIKEQGVIGAINAQKTLAKQTAELTKYIDTLAAHYTISSKQIVRAIETYNAKVAETKQGTPIKDIVVGNYKLQLEQIEKIRAAQALASRERDEADKRRMIRIQEEAAQENELFDLRKQRELEIQKIRNFIDKAAPQIQQKTPYEQTKLLIPLMKDLQTVTGKSTDEILKLVKAMYGIDSTVIKNVTNGLHDAKNGIMDTAKEMFNLKSIMNTAFGVGMAMLIFQLQMMVTKFFQDTIQQAKDLSNAIGKLSIAEKVMSKSGTNVSGQDLLTIVSELEKKFTNISNVDMLKATGDTALKMAGTGITPKELQSLLEAGLAAQIRNPEKSIEDVMGTVTNAALTGNVEGVKALGIAISDTIVKEWAVANGLIDDVNDKLTEQQKIHARIGVMTADTTKTLEDTLSLQNNLANAGNKLDASWKNLTEQLAPAVDVWNAILYLASVLVDDLAQAVKFIQGMLDGSIKFSGVFSFLNISVQAYLGTWKLIYAVAQGVLGIYEKLSGQKISEQPSIENLAKQDTPTGPYVPPADETEDNADKIQKALIDLAEAMDQFADRARRMEEDFAETMRRLQEDFNLDRSRFLQDWAIDRQKIIDDSEREMEKKQRDYDRRKRDAEAKLQEDLRQLREKYLMNLDDALHERDARQVLRLGREYAMNRQNLINEFNLRQNSDAAQHAADMEELRRQRNDRLKELDAERALKLKRMDEDFKLKQKRMQEEHKIEMQRLEEEKQDKLRQLAQSLAEQFNLSQVGSQAIYELFLSYFGPGGAVPKVMDSSYKTVVAYAERMAKKLQEILNKFKAVQKAAETIPGNGNVVPSSTGSEVARANGGLDIVSKPTRFLAGELGQPEMVLTVPLNKLSGGIGQLLNGSNKSGGSTSEILISLSPDLEARIIQKSTDNIENSIRMVRRGI